MSNLPAHTPATVEKYDPALVPIGQGFQVAAYVTEKIGPLMQLSEAFSRSGLVPRALAGNPGAVLKIMLRGLELGIPPATALDTIHVIEGKATLSADLMAAKAMEAGATFRYLQSDAAACEIEWTRGGSGGRFRFSIEDAQRAKLTGKDNWKNYPAAMCAARCKATVARMAAPDRLSGLHAPEEIDDEPAPPPVSVTQPGQTRTDAVKAKLAAQAPKPDPTTTASAPKPTSTSGSSSTGSPAGAPTENQNRKPDPLVTEATRAALMEAAAAAGLKDRHELGRFMREVTGRPKLTSADTTEGEAQKAIEALRAKKSPSQDAAEIVDGETGEVVVEGAAEAKS